MFNLFFQVNKMAFLEELHIKNLKIRSLHMGLLLLDNLPRLKKASNFLLDIYGQDLILFKQKLAFLRQKKGLHLDYKEWWKLWKKKIMKSQIQHEIHTVENKQQKLEASPRFGLTDFSCIIHYGEKLLVNNPFLMDSSNLPECRHGLWVFCKWGGDL